MFNPAALAPIQTPRDRIEAFKRSNLYRQPILGIVIGQTLIQSSALLPRMPFAFNYTLSYLGSVLCMISLIIARIKASHNEDELIASLLGIREPVEPAGEKEPEV